MPSLATRRKSSRVLAFLAFALVALAASDAPAQSGGGIRGYYRNFYGQDFYDGQYNGTFVRLIGHKQYNGGHYGPMMMYGREYADSYGYITNPPFRRSRNRGGNSAGGYDNALNP